jgi:hypothetical protein
MDALDSPNVSEDITVPVGCDLNWAFSLEPWSTVGTTASFIAGGTPFAMVTSDAEGADDTTSSFSVHLTPAQMVTLGLNVSGNTQNYVVQQTMTDGSIWPLGYGVILAQ